MNTNDVVLAVSIITPSSVLSIFNARQPLQIIDVDNPRDAMPTRNIAMTSSLLLCF